MATKDVRTMTAAQLNKELERIDTEESELVDAMIAAGRGSETYSETATKTDPLARAYVANAERAAEIHYEMNARYGANVSRLPAGRGFGPRA